MVNASESKGGTALSFAAAQGHIMLVDMLLARDDIDVNHPKEDGTTALFNACVKGQVGGEVECHCTVTTVTVSGPEPCTE